MNLERRRVTVLESSIDATDLSGAVKLLLAWGTERKGRVVCACNVHSVVQARRDPPLAAAIGSADLALPDGAPVAWLMRRAGFAAQRRVSGPDLMWAYLGDAAAQGQGVFLYGATDRTLALLRRQIEVSFPGVLIAGMFAPPFRRQSQAEDDAVVARINASGASSVWVALGCPKQEVWMEEHRGRVDAVMIGVGAAFDFHAGTLRRAPIWMQGLGLEWLHRLLEEPRRLWRRYLVTNTVFAIQALRQLARS